MGKRLIAISKVTASAVVGLSAVSGAGVAIQSSLADVQTVSLAQLKASKDSVILDSVHRIAGQMASDTSPVMYQPQRN